MSKTVESSTTENSYKFQYLSLLCRTMHSGWIDSCLAFASCQLFPRAVKITWKRIDVSLLMFNRSSSILHTHCLWYNLGNWRPLWGLSVAYLPGLWFVTLVKLCCGWWPVSRGGGRGGRGTPEQSLAPCVRPLRPGLR